MNEATGIHLEGSRFGGDVDGGRSQAMGGVQAGAGAGAVLCLSVCLCVCLPACFSSPLLSGNESGLA